MKRSATRKFALSAMTANSSVSYPSRRRRYRHITEQQHRIALEAVFGLKEEYGYKELEDALIKTYASVGVKLNHQKAVPLITMLRNKRMIVQQKGRKYTFMPDFHY